MKKTDLEIAAAAVLFDCDAVLVDSTDSGERAWRRWAIDYGLDPARVLDGVHGRRSAETVALYLPTADRAEGLSHIEALEIGDAASTEPIAGARELLAQLPGNWAGVPSASAALLQARLTAAGLPTPAIAVTADDVDSGKPDPAGYRQAALRLGQPTSTCVVVEDSPVGVQAGRAAGAGAVVGVSARVLGTDADLVVRDLAGISWLGAALAIAGGSRLR